MFEKLEKMNSRPKPFEFYTASDLWTDEHTSKMMLACHLNEEIDLSSRNAKFIQRSVEWIISYFNIGKGTKIADFGCGPGLYTTKLAKKQADVTGIDFSKRSLQHAQKVAEQEKLSIQYVNDNYLGFETEKRFDLIQMIYCDFCALSPSQRKQMLTKFHKLLVPGGAVLLDVHSLKAFEEREEATSYETNLLNGFWSPDKYYGFLNTFKYQEEKVMLDKYTLIEAGRTRMVYNWLQYFSLEALKSEFEEAGLTIEKIFSDVAGSPFDSETNDFAIVARKL
jgi:cyclopropane fatty-acyl-phospholipid synthase-like methyltransferase